MSTRPSRQCAAGCQDGSVEACWRAVNACSQACCSAYAAETVHRVTNGTAHHAPLCVLGLGTTLPAGFADILSRVNLTLTIARSFGCAAVVPPVSALMHAKHNQGQSGPLGSWSKYFRMGLNSELPDLWEELPGNMSKMHQVTITDRIPNEIELAARFLTNSSETHGPGWQSHHREHHRVAVVSLRFDALWRVNFWGATISDRMMASVCRSGRAGCTRFVRNDFFLADALMRGSRQASAAVFKGTPYVAIKVRRGDKVRDQLSRDCTNSTNVLRTASLARKRAEAHLGRSVEQIFFMTDGDSRYEAGVVEALQTEFRIVRREADLPGELRIPGDNAHNFLLAQRLAHTASAYAHVNANYWMVRVHSNQFTTPLESPLKRPS